MPGLFYTLGKSARRVYRPRKSLKVKPAAPEILYSTFWNRAKAVGIDFAVLLALPIAGFWMFCQSRAMAAAAIIATALILEIYFIGSHWRFGQTIGKRIMKLKVTRPNGARINLRQALVRSGVDMIVLGSAVCFCLYVVLSWDKPDWSSLGVVDRLRTFNERYPAAGGYIRSVSLYWYLLEVLVLLLSSKRRALHDLVASTVVISLDKTPKDA